MGYCPFWEPPSFGGFGGGGLIRIPPIRPYVARIGAEGRALDTVRNTVSKIEVSNWLTLSEVLTCHL